MEGMKERKGNMKERKTTLHYFTACYLLFPNFFLSHHRRGTQIINIKIRNFKSKKKKTEDDILKRINFRFLHEVTFLFLNLLKVINIKKNNT